MSFSADVKSELCKLPFGKDCCIIAELYGFMLYANQFGKEKIKIHLDNGAVRKRMFSLLRKALKCVYIVDDCTGNVLIEDCGVIEKIFNLFGYEYNNSSLHINRAVVEEDCCKEAFVRGAFLASGYLSNPEKEYHMEFVTTHFNISSELLILLDEMEFSAKMINRRGNHVIYYKGSEMIEKMLTFMGASNSAMELMLKKVEKNLKNNINRKVNCEISNLTKTADASAQQIEAIYTLKEKNQYDELPKPLKEVAELRLANPELTLGELAKMCVPPITKPGLSGRMRKIIKLAKDA